MYMHTSVQPYKANVKNLRGILTNWGMTSYFIGAYLRSANQREEEISG